MVSEEYVKKNYKIIKTSGYIGSYFADPKYHAKYVLAYNPKLDEYDIFEVVRYDPATYNLEGTEKTLEDGLREYENQFAMAHADAQMRKKKSTKPKLKKKTVKKCRCK